MDVDPPTEATDPAMNEDPPNEGAALSEGAAEARTEEDEAGLAEAATT
jgi:hypothetical protein